MPLQTLPIASVVDESITVPADAEQLGAVHAALDRFWQSVERRLGRQADLIERLQFETAVAEIGANIVRYAYPNGGARGAMRLRLRLIHCCAVACFADQGVAFLCPADDEDADDIAPAFAESGRGLDICRAGLSRLRYQRTSTGTNRWLLLKQLQVTPA